MSRKFRDFLLFYSRFQGRKQLKRKPVVVPGIPSDHRIGAGGSWSAVRDGSTLCRVLIRACPVPALYAQDSRACSNVSGWEFEHSVQVAGVVGVILWRRSFTGSSRWRSLKLKLVISLLRPLSRHSFQLICQSLSGESNSQLQVIYCLVS